ncbi:Imm49 family immunity protein [Streptomyces sp. NPDC050600]|uniref:Imm49 family immunity protein n=1 Tax=Streptomyces sp. NPDC050600 TaxID=3157213 RepID=UPI0034396755
MRDVTSHEVDGERIERALEGIRSRTFGHWHDLRYGGGVSLSGLAKARDELLDHVGACSVAGPGPDGPDPRQALLTAAECAIGALGLGCFPEGDWDVRFLPLVDETLSSDEQLFDESWDTGHEVPTARTWTETFALCLLGGALWTPRRVVGPLLHADYAPAIRSGVPYSRFDSVSRPAELAEMDALCAYLSADQSWERPVPLRLPDAEERGALARALDEAGELDPDQRLLRVLLDADRDAFDGALADRLDAYRASAEAAGDQAPGSLLPVRTAALAALARQAHGWAPGVRSAYLPDALLVEPERETVG